MRNVTRVVIVGAGFAGLEAAKRLAKCPVEILLIDRHNHHLFQPLLYQVATAGLSPANIASPIRKVLRRAKNVRVILDEVTAVDKEAKCVVTREGSHPFDFLILATGAQNSYFGNDEWAQFAPGLKTLGDATAIRARILEAFEKAEVSERQEEWLTFVIVGGGPTGVELAGSIAELAKRALAADFRSTNPEKARIVLIEGGERVLSAFPPGLSADTRRSLETLGVEVLENTFVCGIDAEGADTDKGRIDAKTVLWAAGVRSTPVAKWLETEGDRQGRIIVEPNLTLRGHPSIFVVGDCARIAGSDNRPLPGVCQTAIQSGVFAARTIAARISGKESPEKFVYKDKGTMATIGRKMAVCKIGRLEICGFWAWVLWLFVHVAYLIEFRNRIITLAEWAWAYVTFERGARLIVRD